jgi:hypothetical protein
MRRLTLITVTVVIFVSSTCNISFAQDDLKIWNEFVEAVKNDQITPDRIRTYDNLPKDMLLQWIKMFKEGKLWEQIQGTPEVHKVGEHIHYIVTFAKGDWKSTFCHTFLIEDGKWYFRHLENITIRLDQIPVLPTSKFPDLPEEKKAWQRQEIYWTEQVRLFNFLTREKGKNFAFNWFKDGDGYLLTAKTWVPFYPSEKAFILYLCWEQANLRVTLEKFDDNEAVARMKPMYLQLYKQTAHLKAQISFEDYLQIFETIWQDRATKAGWNLDITYNGDECLFNFQRKK